MSYDENEKPIVDQDDENEDVFGMIASAARPLAPPAHLKQRIMDRVRNTTLSPVTTRDVEGWRELAPGIEFKYLFTDAKAHSKSFLLRAAPGVSMPGHYHCGPEECLVLEGEFSMGDIKLKAGDFHCVGAGTYHDDAKTESGVLVYIRADQNDYAMIQP